MADAEADSTAEQPFLTPAERSLALVWVQLESHGWDHPRVLWRSQDDPEGEPLFSLEDAIEGGARAPSSNFASWRSSRCGQRCPLWPRTCLVLPRYAPPFVVLCRLFLSFLTVLDVCSTYPGARGPVPWEVDVPSVGEGRLGLAPVAEGLGHQCQRASVGAERRGGGPPPSLC